ncbi:MAG: hypothetical protein WD491_11600 [Balneolales bacterium]
MAHRRKNDQKKVIYLAVLILIFIVTGWGYLSFIQQQKGSSTAEAKEEISENFGSVANDLLAYAREGLSKNEINSRLENTFELLINAEDITADGNKEFVVIERNPNHAAPHRSLRQFGYEETIKGMTIYQRNGGSMVPLFILTPENMLNEHGTVLIEQVDADHGYAMQNYDHNDNSVYSKTVQLFDVVILDKQGGAVSDDITIYWDPVSKLYRATNTLGAPGTYSQ